MKLLLETLSASSAVFVGWDTTVTVKRSRWEEMGKPVALEVDARPAAEEVGA